MPSRQKRGLFEYVDITFNSSENTRSQAFVSSIDFSLLFLFFYIQTQTTNVHEFKAIIVQPSYFGTCS